MARWFLVFRQHQRKENQNTVLFWCLEYTDCILVQRGLDVTQHEVPYLSQSITVYTSILTELRNQFIHIHWRDLVINVLVWFYGISTIVGNLIPNPVFIYVLDISFENKLGRYTQLNDQTVLFLTKCNSSKYCYVQLTIQLNISNLFTHS